MNDPKILRAESDKARQGIAERSGRYSPVLEEFLTVDGEHRVLLQEVETMRARRNEASKAIGKAKAAKDEATAQTLMAEVAELKKRMEVSEPRLAEVAAKAKALLLSIPNLPHASIPRGKTPEDNKVARVCGEPRKPAFKPLDHAGVGEKLGMMDFGAGARLSGSRFSVLKGGLARLERCIGQFMLDLHTRQHGYMECWVPHLVLPQAVEGVGQLPKFEQDLYRTGQFEEAKEGPGKSDAMYLISTGEVPLTNLVREQILDEAALPMKLTALTPCYRQEAGSYGKDVKGLIRQHQFDKVELVWITKPEVSMKALEELTGHAEAVLRALELPYRVVELCTGDIGFSSCKTYDLEVWMGGEGIYREISSCSNCWDFQARRMGARFRRGKEVELVHTLNGSGVAVGRALAAVLEYYQREDGSVEVPKVLRPYFGADELKKA